MYSSILPLHSFFRWLVLFSLLYSIFRAYQGYTKKKTFTRADDGWRHWTATIAHVQLIIGFVLYFSSPIVAFWSKEKDTIQNLEISFFGWIHATLMLTAIVVLTLGSAFVKRATSDHKKFQTMLVWFVLALLLIFIAIPWPFSPLAARPYIRP